MRGDFRVTNVTAFVLVAMMLTFGIILAAALPELRRGAQQDLKTSDTLSKLPGDWAGESVCVGDRPACKDELVVYHITLKEGATDTVTIAADKVIDGVPEQMYVLDFKYDAAEDTLTGEFNVKGTHGVYEYAVKGDRMEGTGRLLPAGTVFRRIKVKRAPNQAPVKPPRV